VTEPQNPEIVPFLVGRARSGDSSAFEQLVGMYRDQIFRWALVRTGDVDDAEDATQEALLRMHRGLRKFEGAARFETWLYAVVRNAALDVGRRGRRVVRLKEIYASRVAPAVSTGPPAVVGQMETERIGKVGMEFLEALPARQREAMDLVDLQGIGQAEAAEMLGIRPSTLRVHLLRARRTLRGRLLEKAPGAEEAE